MLETTVRCKLTALRVAANTFSIERKWWDMNESKLKPYGTRLCCLLMSIVRDPLVLIRSATG